MKTIEETLLNRTSVRRYEYDKIPSETLDFIYRAIANTPTSYNGQQFSVIAIDDQSIKEELYAITNQKQIKTCATLLVFCADYHKIDILAQKKGIDNPHFENTLDGVMVGIIDAALAMQNAVVAAQAAGLGSCCVGYARTANPEKIAEILKLPEGTFVVCALTLGIPRESPDVKPKQPLSLVIHHNHYRTDDMAPELEQYDQTISEYNRHRSGTTSENDWCAHILDYYRIALGYDMEGYLNKQGFKLPFSDNIIRKTKCSSVLKQNVLFYKTKRTSVNLFSYLNWHKKAPKKYVFFRCFLLLSLLAISPKITNFK